MVFMSERPVRLCIGAGRAWGSAPLGVSFPGVLGGFSRHQRALGARHSQLLAATAAPALAALAAAHFLSRLILAFGV